jgi:hypothetical protein
VRWLRLLGGVAKSIAVQIPSAPPHSVTKPLTLQTIISASSSSDEVAGVRVRLGRYRVPKHLVSPPRDLLIKLGMLLIVPDGDLMCGKLQRLAGQVIPLRDVTACPVNDRLQLGNDGPLEGVRGPPAAVFRGLLSFVPSLPWRARETATVTLYLPFLVRDNGCRHASVWP